LQREIAFHEEAYYRQNEKFNLLSANKASV